MIDEKAINRILDVLNKDGYECFASEAQLRDTFAIKLCMMYPNCIVIPEYTKSRPVGWRCSEKLIYFDLLVFDTDNEEKILIEFKYKTSSGSFNINNGTYIELHNQSDVTNGRYAIWRDIYRIETFTDLNEFDKGFIVFVTNNKTYYAKPEKGTIAEQFSLEPGLHLAGSKSWNTPDPAICPSIQRTYRKDTKPLLIKNDYSFEYKDYSRISSLSGEANVFVKLILPIYHSAYKEKIEEELGKMGKSVFVKYYYSFKTGDSDLCKKEISKESYTGKAVATRVSCGIRMFKEGRNIEGLRVIINSSKVDEIVRKQAVDILNKELEVRP